jgi:hypothetical protein
MLERFLDDCHGLTVNLNDTFYYSSADAEDVIIGDAGLFADFWQRHGWYGLVAIAAWKRKRHPLPQVAQHPKYKAALEELRSDEPVNDWLSLRETLELEDEGL